ncbi:MAG: hypothetical protein ACYC4B_21120 [Pirellulaceae bacterium]
MDQLKQAFSVLKKHHFWLLCILIVVLYVGTWFMSTSSMTKATEARTGVISSAFSSGDRIAQIQNHPNPASAEMMESLNRAEAEQVRLAWERRFREQEDVLVWPQELLPDFIAAVEPLKPIEAKVEFPTPPQQELKMEFRNRYRDYIRKELPKLAEIIGAEWRVAAESSGSGTGMPGMGMPGMGMPGMGMPGMGMPGMGMPGMGAPGGSSGYPGMGSSGGGSGLGTGSRRGSGGYPGMSSPLGGGPMAGGAGGVFGSDLLTAEGKPIVVEWSSANQAALQASSMNWTSPTTLQVLYAQEDLWVLRALMLIIKATNGDADAQYNAAVKEIESINLGPSAPGFKFVGRVSVGGAGQGSMAGMYGMPGGMPGGMMPGGMMPGGMMPGGAGSTPPGGAVAPGASAAPGGASGAGSSSAPGGGSSSSMPYGPMSGMGGLGGGQAFDPAEGRYVDDKNEPLTAERLRSAIKSEQPADAFLAVAKRMPMRMRVRMNVLKLPLFLCEFSESNLPVEIRQVRINAPAGMGSGGSSGYGGGGMPSMPMPGGGGGPPGGAAMPGLGGGGMATGGPMLPGMGGGGMLSGGMGGGMSASGMGGPGGPGGMRSGRGQMGATNTESPYDATVEIYGLIYIYNPVDASKLGIETDADGTADGTDNETNGAGASEAGTGSATAAPGAKVDDDAALDSGLAPDNGADPATPAAITAPSAEGTATPAVPAEPTPPANGTPANGTPANGTASPAPPPALGENNGGS